MYGSVGFRNEMGGLELGEHRGRKSGSEVGVGNWSTYQGAQLNLVSISISINIFLLFSVSINISKYSKFFFSFNKLLKLSFNIV